MNKYIFEQKAAEKLIEEINAIDTNSKLTEVTEEARKTHGYIPTNDRDCLTFIQSNRLRTSSSCICMKISFGIIASLFP